MSEQAFDDQCTGANPRYPLISEIRQMYLNAYYGNRHFEEEPQPKAAVISKDKLKKDFKQSYRNGSKKA